MTTINDIFNIPTVKECLRILSEHKYDLSKDSEIMKRIQNEYNFYVAVNRECEKAGIARHFNVAMPEDMDNKHKNTGDALSNHPKPNKGHKK